MYSNAIRLRAGASAFALIMVVGVGSAALAAAPQPNQQVTTIQEIVVTAQKREQSLQKVPMSVTALTAATLSQAGVVDMQGVSNLTPSLTTVETNGSQSQSYRVRGVGSDPNIPTFEPDVALFIDGVYLPRSGLGVDDLVDLSRVEVLEGPQSTLYGKNATAGVINVVTKGPSHTFEASAEASVSNLDSSLQALVTRFAGTVSGPLNDRIRARISAVSYTQGDSYKNLEPGAPNTNNLHRYAVRGEIEADLWTDTTLRVDASRSEVYNTRTGQPDLLNYSFSPPNNAAQLDFGPLGSLFHILPCPDNDPSNRIVCTSAPNQLSTFSNVLSATLNSKVGRNSFTSITAISDYHSHLVNADAAQVILPVALYSDVQKGGTFSQEFRLASPTGDRLEWLAGAYFQHTGFAAGNNGKSPTFVMEAAAPFVPLPGAPPTYKLGAVGDEGFQDSKSRSTYGALFGQATWRFNDQFALTLGGRGQTEAKHASIDNSYAVSPATPFLPFPPQLCAPIPGDLIAVNLTPTHVCHVVAPGQVVSAPINGAFAHSTSSFTWNATGEYHPSKDTMLYVTASRGSKSFGYNIGFGTAPDSSRPFKDEYVYNYEGGIKTSVLDGRAKLAASIFHADYHNYQNAGFVGLQFLVDNAERMSVTGAEANGAFALGHGFTANVAATYIDAKYDRYTHGSCFYGEPPNNGVGGCDLSGKGLPLAPHWRSSLGLQYRRNLPFGSFYSRADWTWQSSDLTDTNLDPRSRQNGYGLVNLHVGVKTEGGLDVSLWGNNVFNKTYSMADGVSNLFGANDPEFQRYLGRPREYGLTLRKSF